MDDENKAKSYSELYAFEAEQVKKRRKHIKKLCLLGILFLIWFFCWPMVFLCGCVFNNIILIILGASAFVGTTLVIIIVQLINNSSKKKYILTNNQTKTVNAIVLDSIANYYVRRYGTIGGRKKYQQVIDYKIILLINNIECTGSSNMAYEKNAEIAVLYNEKYPNSFVIPELID